MKKYFRKWVVFWLLLLCPWLVNGQELKDRVIEGILDNGLKVLMMERHASPTVAAYILFKAGSVDETEGSYGIAHMLEHMLFKGTKTIGTRNYQQEKPILEEIERLVEEIAAEKAKKENSDANRIAELEKKLNTKQEEQKAFFIRGEYESLYTRHGGVGFNAGTSNDYTIYTIELPANKLELWTFLESDRLKNHVFREFYIERNAVAEERRMRVDTDPQGKLFETFLSTAFRRNPYGRPILGYEADIEGMTTKKAAEFFRIHYAPGNSVMVIVGDINPEHTLSLIKAYFGDLPSQLLPEWIPEKEPKQNEQRR
ncbi:MAG: pitrilysin family protein, partial [Spirochaetota bacterium]